MNHHCVPDFKIEMVDDEYPMPSAPSGLPRQKKPSVPEDDIMELLWQNGQVVMQSQNQRPQRKPPPDTVIQAGPSTAREIRPSQQQFEQNYQNQQQHIFMQEDEMISWLHYPMVDDPPLDHNFCVDILYLQPQPPPIVNNNNSSIQNPDRMSQATELRQTLRSVAQRSHRD